MSATYKEQVMEMALAVDETVNRIANVYISFNLPKYEQEANKLRGLAQKDLNLEHAKNGELIDGNIITNLVDNSDGDWVLTLAAMLGFSFKGIYLPRLSTKEGVEIEHTWLPFKARLVERFISQDNHTQNSFTLYTNFTSEILQK